MKECLKVLLNVSSFLSDLILFKVQLHHIINSKVYLFKGTLNINGNSNVENGDIHLSLRERDAPVKVNLC